MINSLHSLLADSIASNYASLPWISPALWLVGILLVNLLLQAIISPTPLGERIYKAVGMVGLMGALITSVSIQKRIMGPMMFANQLLYLTSSHAMIHSLCIGFVIGMVIITSILPAAKHNPSHLMKGAYFPMVLAMLLGAYWLTIANHWLLAYLAMVILAIASSALMYHPAEPFSIRSSARYMVYSMVFSAIMLVGLSYLYGSTGTLLFGKEMFLMKKSEYALLGALGGVLTLSGLMMMLGSFPFQFWVVKVYENVSFTTVAYLSTLPKIAGIYFLVQLHHLVKEHSSFVVVMLWKEGWSCIAIITLLVGSIGALRARHVKHILAYGSIAQTGFLLVFVVLDTTHTSSIMGYYMIVYSVMNAASWLGLQFFNDFNPSLLLKSYAGLGRQVPMMGVCFFVIMLALVGLPPTGGFSAKFLLLSQLWQEAMISQGKILSSLFVVALLSTLLSLYYYLKIPYLLFLKSSLVGNKSVDRRSGLILLLLVLSLLGLFFIQSWFL